MKLKKLPSNNLFRKLFIYDLSLCKAFDSIPHFENLGYQVEIINLYLKFQRLHKPNTIKSTFT